MKTLRLIGATLAIVSFCCAAIGQTIDGPASVEQVTVFIKCSVGPKTYKGTGVIVTADGLVLTAKHVVPENAECAGEIGRPSPNPTFLLTRDAHPWPDWDIIALRIAKEQGRTFPYVRYHKIVADFKGKSILARGIKAGGSEIAVSAGIISTVNVDSRGFIETDALTSRGMSGGPVVLSDDGGLVGIIVGAELEGSPPTPRTYGVFAIQAVAADLGLTEAPQAVSVNAPSEHCKPEACRAYYNAFRLGVESKLYRITDQLVLWSQNPGNRPPKAGLVDLADKLHLNIDVEMATSEQSGARTSNIEGAFRDRLQILYPADAVNMFDVGVRVGGAAGFKFASTTDEETTIAMRQWDNDLYFINKAADRFGIPKLNAPRGNGKEDLSIASCAVANAFSEYFVGNASDCTDAVARYQHLVEGARRGGNSIPSHEVTKINGKRLVYFKKASDLGIVIDTLATNNLYPDEQPGTNDQATNVISCQPDDDIEKIKWIARILLEAGVRLQGIAPQARRTDLIGIEHYKEYARMPVLNAYLLDAITRCPTWDSELPSPYISVRNNCPYQIYGTMTYKDPFANSWISRSVEIPPYSRWFLANEDGSYPSSQLSYLQFEHPNGNRVTLKIGQRICG
ncbi:UNVERIFIED_ORG: hypothetical protein GGI63_000129 [Rhizobium esperanzae]|nr:hypothetical protein RHECNPAF_870018 [Rhizobium etli CNPAF512]